MKTMDEVMQKFGTTTEAYQARCARQDDAIRERLRRGNWRHSEERPGVLQKVISHFDWSRDRLPELEEMVIRLSHWLEASETGSSWRVTAVLFDKDSPVHLEPGDNLLTDLSPLQSRIAKDCMIARGNLDVNGVEEAIYFCPASLFKRLDNNRDIDDWEEGLDLPKLTGSVKQVEWARATRSELLPAILDYSAEGTNERDQFVLTEAKGLIRSQATADYWINAKKSTELGPLKQAIESLYRREALNAVRRLGLV